MEEDSGSFRVPNRRKMAPVKDGGGGGGGVFCALQSFKGRKALRCFTSGLSQMILLSCGLEPEWEVSSVPMFFLMETS